MPGAFHPESANGGTFSSGVHPGMFRTPISPSPTSSLYLGTATGNMYVDAPTPTSNVKRKRHIPRESTPLHDWAMSTSDAGLNADHYEDKYEAGRFNREGERRYVLAGQMDTPNGVAPADIKQAMEDSVYSDIDYRRGLGSKRAHNDFFESPNSRYSAVARQQNNGWGSFALSTIGGVVGKVFQFCKTGVFRGFYAGGGTGYEIGAPSTPSRQLSSSNGQVWCNEHDIPTLPGFDMSATPGGFPQSDYAPFQFERGTPESTPPPAAKRRHINDGTPGDELRNWVMVKEPVEKARPQSRASMAPTGYAPQQQAYPPVLRRRISKPVSRVSTPSFARRESSRISHASSAPLSNREPASFASPRSQSPAPSYAPSRIPVPSRPQTPNLSPTRLSQQPSLIPSPSVLAKRGHRRNHSMASNASAASGRATRTSRRGSVQELFEDNSPRLDPEAKHLAARRMQEEMETDIKMDDFSARIRDMIRQGKEALGTTVEVEDGGEGRDVDIWEDD